MAPPGRRAREVSRKEHVVLIAYWILAGILAVLYLMAGSQKVYKSKETLLEAGLAWAKSFPAWAIKGIGALEIAGAVGLLMPALTKTSTLLAPLAALGLALLQMGAVVLHLRRGETNIIAMNIALLLMAAAATWLGFALWT